MENEQSREQFLEARLETYLKPLFRDLQILLPKTKDATLVLVNPELLTADEVEAWDTYAASVKLFADELRKLHEGSKSIELIVKELSDLKKQVYPEQNKSGFANDIEERKQKLFEESRMNPQLEGRAHFYNWLNNRLTVLVGNLNFCLEEIKGSKISASLAEELPILLQETQIENQQTSLIWVQKAAQQNKGK